MTTRHDAIIIGAGIIGACIAYELAKAGRKTLVIDKNPASGYGSTANSCAIVRTHYSTVSGAALALSNYPYWENWPQYLGVENDDGCAKYREVGCIYTCYKENNYGQKLIDIAHQLNIPCEIWTAEAMRKRIPIIDPGNYYPVQPADSPAFGQAHGQMRQVLYFPKAGYVSDPQLATRNVQRSAQAHGAQFCFNARVTQIEQNAGRVAGVRIETGERFDAKVVVNAAGPHSYKINELAGITESMNISTRALRVEVAHVPSPQGYDFEQNGIIGSDANIGSYYRPEVGNSILIGSEEPACDELEWVDPDNFNTNLTRQARLQVMRAAQRFPTIGIPNQLKGIADLYDVTDDWIPIYDKSDLPGFFMAIGTSGNQFKNGPVVGMLMAALVNAVENGLDHDNDPFVYALPNIDRMLNLSFFSRRRVINRESSFSVAG